jgi:hypothetical protein
MEGNKNQSQVIYCLSTLDLVKVTFPRVNALHIWASVPELLCAGPYTGAYDVPPDIHKHRSKCLESLKPLFMLQTSLSDCPGAEIIEPGQGQQH